MHFLTPMGLLLGLLSVPLVALYFLRLRRRKVRVSSLLPWHAVKRSEHLASPFQRFRSCSSCSCSWSWSSRRRGPSS